MSYGQRVVAEKLAAKLAPEVGPMVAGAPIAAP